MNHDFMSEAHNLFESRQQFDLGNGEQGTYYSLPALEQAGLGRISRLPVSIRVVLESVLRNVDGVKVSEADVRNLAAWNAKSPAKEEVPFTVAGTSLAGADHELAPGTVVIPAGTVHGLLQVPLIDDMVEEPLETILITLGVAENGVLGDADTHRIDLLDDDPPPTVSFEQLVHMMVDADLERLDGTKA